MRLSLKLSIAAESVTDPCKSVIGLICFVSSARHYAL